MPDCASSPKIHSFSQFSWLLRPDPLKRTQLEVEKHELTRRLIEAQLKGNPVKDYFIPLGSLLVALLGVLSGVYAQYIGSQATVRAATITGMLTREETFASRFSKHSKERHLTRHAYGGG